MFTNPIKHLIASLFYYFDSKCREGLHRKLITSERDYVSRLVTFISFPFGPFIRANFALARSLTHSEEQKFGCDGLIIFKNNTEVKVGLFEAKWPRYFIKSNYPWDKPTANASSRFSSQLTRQNNWTQSAAIWNMFFNESKVGNINPPFDTNGSACIWHDVAYNYMNANNLMNRVWKNNDLINLLNNRPTNFRNPNYSTNLRHIIFNILDCRKGIIHNIGDRDTSFIITSKDEKEVEIPILFDFEDQQLTIESFFEETGLRYYALIEKE